MPGPGDDCPRCDARLGSEPVYTNGWVECPECGFIPAQAQ